MCVLGLVFVFDFDVSWSGKGTGVIRLLGGVGVCVEANLLGVRRAGWTGSLVLVDKTERRVGRVRRDSVDRCIKNVYCFVGADSFLAE